MGQGREIFQIQIGLMAGRGFMARTRKEKNLAIALKLCDEQQEEAGKFLDATFIIHQDKRMKRLYVEARKLGLDPAEILKKALAKIR